MTASIGTASAGTEAIAEAFARAQADGRRAALMPYLMGGYPDLETSRRIGLAYADAGADLVELGVPFSDPLADGPVIHAAGTAALARGRDAAGGPRRRARRSRDRVPVVLMCYANVILVARPGALPRRARGGRGERADRARPARTRRPPTRARPATRASWRSFRSWRRPRPQPRLARIGRDARGFVYAVSLTGTTGERAAVGDGLAGVVSRGRRPDRGPGGGRIRHRHAPSRPPRRRPPAPTA